MTDKEQIRNIVTLYMAWTGENKVVPTEDIDSAVDFIIDNMQEESKKCMFTKEEYTNEDRNILCDGCEETCEHNRTKDDFDEDSVRSAELYADKKLEAVDPELAATKYKRHTKMGVRIFDGSDVEEAYLEGMKVMEQKLLKTAKLDGWIARDERGSLHLFEIEPRRLEDCLRWWDRDYTSIGLDEKDFPDLKWEDEPVYVKLPIIKVE